MLLINSHKTNEYTGVLYEFKGPIPEELDHILDRVFRWYHGLFVVVKSLNHPHFLGWCNKRGKVCKVIKHGKTNYQRALAEFVSVSERLLLITDVEPCYEYLAIAACMLSTGKQVYHISFNNGAVSMRRL